MRRFALLAGVLALAAGRLAAQHAGQVEVGAFGSYTRYDATFGLAHKIGGGVRMGYVFGSIVGLEADVLFQPEYTVVPPSGTPSTLQPLIASASLVVNAVHASRLMVYVLGGYSLLDFGTRHPVDVRPQDGDALPRHCRALRVPPGHALQGLRPRRRARQ